MDSWRARSIDHWLERAGPWLVAVLLALILWIATGASLAKPLWHDEIYTWLLARLPSAGTIWSAHRDGVDLQPPLNTLATRAAHRLFGSGVTATRLPAFAGFGLTTMVVFTMLRRRAGTTLALAGALIPVQTAAFRYSYEARGYGLMLGCVALALFAWAEAAHGGLKRRMGATAAGGSSPVPWRSRPACGRTTTRPWPSSQLALANVCAGSGSGGWMSSCWRD